ncbi:type II toxin-antitoxin system toxin DNA ADP-ribosyl transferase DarT [Desulfolutivibrio sp.]|uniref:type II toxin-antitoxin system toxin DNA ADP-ribosyl transferase DarT n=1 Tax=Desulfolutivibrio sp. TaxID=2773296 RepID=UPI003FA4CAAB
MATIFHFTALHNLLAILQTGGIVCDSRMAARSFVNIGHDRIKTRRTLRKVPVASCGVVADYVPFYFAPRSPMLYSIHRGNVPNCTYKQTDVIYFAFDSDDIFSSALSYCFTDRNAVLAHAQFSTSLAEFNSNFIDWPLMREQMWNNTPNDTERMERRMAEFLVHDFIPLSLLRGLAVYSAANMTYVNNLISGYPQPLQVILKPDWYF